jgi:radical SAM/SPASM domain protein of ACGX system
MKPHFLLQWHITTDCDQRCRHCYVFNSPASAKEIQNSKNVTFTFLKTIADNFIASCDRLDVLPLISLGGGDPLLSPHFWKLLRYLHSKRVETAIMGNPFHISDVVAKKLRSFGIYSFQLSLDGLEKTHDSFRKNGSFKATFEAAKILMKHGIKVNIMSTVSKTNAPEIPELTRLIVEAKINSTSFARHCPTSSSDKTLMFKPLEYRAFLKKMFRVYFYELYNKRTNFFLKDHLWKLLLNEMGLFTPRFDDGCGVGTLHLMAVLADGTVYACRRFNSPIGKVPNQKFDDIFFSQSMAKYRTPRNYIQCSACELFNYCRGCRAVAACMTGSWQSPDPQCWRFINK